MESAQEKLMSVLLEMLYTRGLLSKAVYLGALDFVYSATDTPLLFRSPAFPTEEAGQ